MVDAIERDFINIGSGIDLSIKELAHAIKKTTGYEGTIEWDTSKPDGQPRRKLDTSRASERFGFDAKISNDTFKTRRHSSWFLLDVSVFA